MSQAAEVSTRTITESITWEFVVDYNKIKHVPWKADVYDRLVKVRQDVRYAISAKGWTAVEGKDGGTLTITATAPPGQEADEADEALIHMMRGVADDLVSAMKCLNPHTFDWRHWLRDLAAAWRALFPLSLPGGALMASYISLHAAEAGAVLLLDNGRFKAKLPSIYEQATAYLPKGDKRITAITDLMSPKAAPSPGVDNWAAWEALTYANKIEDQQQWQVRQFRTMIVATFIGALLVAVGLGIAAHAHPDYFPLCVLKGASNTAQVCPSGGGTESGSDAPLVMGMGALGAILSVVISLSGTQPPGVRYSLSAVQALLKIAFGALTAILGIMILSTVLSSDSTVLNSQLKLLVAAAIFGYSQQLFTSVVDRKATNLQDAAAGK